MTAAASPVVAIALALAGAGDLGLEPVAVEERSPHVLGRIPGDVRVGADVVVVGATLVPGRDTAAVFGSLKEAVRRIGARPRQGEILVALWSPGGPDPLALLEQAGHARERLRAYVEIGAEGEDGGERLAAVGAGSSAAWRALLERANVVAGFDLSVDDAPAALGAAARFDQARIPSVVLRGGGSGAAARIGQLVSAIVLGLDGASERPAYRPPQHSGSSRPRGVFTGTVPDYAAAVSGLRLSGVIAGGPAERAGLREGDVIVELAGVAIDGAEGYARALEGLEPGRSVSIVVVRHGERLEKTIVPLARD